MKLIKLTFKNLLILLIISVTSGCATSRYHHLKRASVKATITKRESVKGESDTTKASSSYSSINKKVTDTISNKTVLDFNNRIKSNPSKKIKSALSQPIKKSLDDSTKVDIEKQSYKAERYAKLGFKFALASAILLIIAILCAFFLEIDAIGITIFFLSRLLNIISIWFGFSSFLKKNSFSLKLKNQKYLVIGIILNLLMYIAILGIIVSVLG